ncbi:MAG: 30S ribosome-binding factor RbfA [Planctomycetes bacterium]|nr:30S ribosome-binding factor RbfA [Planctomycetota bacterium]
MSHRAEQVASTVQRAVQNVFVRGLGDPRIRGLVSVTSVRVSSDLQHATVLVSIYPDQHQTLAMQGIESATIRIQRLVNEQLHMRRPPRLRFELDLQFKRQAEVLDAIQTAIGDSDQDEEPESAGRQAAETAEDLMRDFGSEPTDTDA